LRKKPVVETLSPALRRRVPAKAPESGARRFMLGAGCSLEFARSDTQLRQWLDNRPPTQRTAVASAAERFAALRQRVIARERASV